MTTIEALLLGIVQGITEFLPVSSSGHLTLGQYLFGLTNLDNYILFDLVCHLGTLSAIFFVFATDIRNLSKDQIVKIAVGTLPLFPAVLFLKKIESTYDQVHLLGFFFLTTAALLYAGIKFGKNQKSGHWIRDCLVIGCFQTLALFPGISRSGSTISSARVLGWDPTSAIRYSFLLAIPAILGGATLKFLQLLQNGEMGTQTTSLSTNLAGFSTSFIFGYASLLLLIKMASKNQFMVFVWYCLILGVTTSLYFFM